MDDDGFLYFVDRAKDMIVSGGLNIYSREVELALVRHAAVADAAVIAVPDPEFGEAVMAFVELANFSNSKTPDGPFHTIVFARPIAWL